MQMLDRSKKSMSSVRLPSSFFHRLVYHLTLCLWIAYKDSKQVYSETNTGLKTTEIQLDIITIKKSIWAGPKVKHFLKSFHCRVSEVLL